MGGEHVAERRETTRLIGIAGEGVDCNVSATGKVTFLAGRIPVAGELVTVLYRGMQRAVARLEDAASVAAEAAGGIPGTARWLGKVLQPVARCSVDCESAAAGGVEFFGESCGGAGGHVYGGESWGCVAGGCARDNQRRADDECARAARDD